MMAMLKLAARSAWARRLTLSVTLVSIAISTAMLLAVERIRLDARQSFTQSVSGVDLVVGARDLAESRPAVDDEVALLIDAGSAISALNELPELQRRTIVLAYFGGYSQSEIAALLDTPLGTIKTRILDGLSRLRRELEAAR